MEALSNMLAQAADNGQIRLHPKCSDPKITHLLFVDDLLVFSDGSRVSLSGIQSVMEKFKTISGLAMNPDKSEIFFGGYSDIASSVLADLAGFKVGSFPTRYLGLPLSPKRLTMGNL